MKIAAKPFWLRLRVQEDCLIAVLLWGCIDLLSRLMQGKQNVGTALLM